MPRLTKIDEFSAGPGPRDIGNLRARQRAHTGQHDLAAVRVA